MGCARLVGTKKFRYLISFSNVKCMRIMLHRIAWQSLTLASAETEASVGEASSFFSLNSA